jgi:hypothetical protein
MIDMTTTVLYNINEQPVARLGTASLVQCVPMHIKRVTKVFCHSIKLISFPKRGKADYEKKIIQSVAVYRYGSNNGNRMWIHVRRYDG